MDPESSLSRGGGGAGGLEGPPVLSLPITYLGDLGGLRSTVIRGFRGGLEVQLYLGVIRTLNLQA